MGGGEKLWGERAGEVHVQGPGRGSPQSKGSWRKAFRAGEAPGVAARGGGLRQEPPAWGAVGRPRRRLVATWGCATGLARGPARRWSRPTCSPRPSPFSSPFDLWRVRENVKIRNFFPWQVILKPIRSKNRVSRSCPSAPSLHSEHVGRPVPCWVRPGLGADATHRNHPPARGFHAQELMVFAYRPRPPSHSAANRSIRFISGK